VASSWICSGVARDLNDLRRVHQLLASSLAKLTQQQCQTTQIYNENVSTLERLAILRAWAKVYICAIEQRRTAKAEMEPGNGLLLGLVEPELDTLVDYWFAALRDFALLSLPSQFGEQVAEIGGTFFTPDSMEVCFPKGRPLNELICPNIRQQICKDHYRASWPLILLACSVWVNQRETEYSSNSATTTTRPHNRAKGDDARLYLMLGICLDSLCSNRQYSADQRPAHICLSSLKNLLTCQWIQLELMSDIRLPIEVVLNFIFSFLILFTILAFECPLQVSSIYRFSHVRYNIIIVFSRLILTRDNMQTQKLCLDLVAAVLAAAERKIAVEAAKLCNKRILIQIYLFFKFCNRFGSTKRE
jgi:HEAT repeat-containing protein 5